MTQLTDSRVLEIGVGPWALGTSNRPLVSAGQQVFPVHDRSFETSVWIDARPVTWDHFERCAAGGGLAAFEDADTVVQLIQSIARKGNARLELDAPITGLNWHEAHATAAFFGARLPFDAEWEAAARHLGLDVQNRFEEWTSDVYLPYSDSDRRLRGVQYLVDNDAHRNQGTVVRGLRPGSTRRSVETRYNVFASERSPSRGFRRVWASQPPRSSWHPDWT